MASLHADEGTGRTTVPQLLGKVVFETVQYKLKSWPENKEIGSYNGKLKLS